MRDNNLGRQVCSRDGFVSMGFGFGTCRDGFCRYGLCSDGRDGEFGFAEMGSLNLEDGLGISSEQARWGSDLEVGLQVRWGASEMGL